MTSDVLTVTAAEAGTRMPGSPGSDAIGAEDVAEDDVAGWSAAETGAADAPNTVHRNANAPVMS
jgi:hypothetical protein